MKYPGFSGVPQKIIEMDDDIAGSAVPMHSELIDRNVTWKSINVRDDIIDVLFKEKCESPSLTQVQALGKIFSSAEKSGIIEAPTGTGKTIAFIITILQRIDPKVKSPQAVIFSPTKLLAEQIATEVFRFTRHFGIDITLLLVEKENFEFNKHSQIVVCTPAQFERRFMSSSVKRGSKLVTTPAEADPSRISVCVIDEADEFARHSNGKNTVDKSLQVLKKSQIFLFSATIDDDVRTRIADMWFGRRPDFFTVKVNLFLGMTRQFHINCRDGAGDKRLSVIRMVYESDAFERGFRSIIFCRTRAEVDTLCDSIMNVGYSVSKYHSQMAPEDRKTSFDDFKGGKTTCLICTNGLARGIDISLIGLVINYQPPTDRNDQGEDVVSPVLYTHRIGRGGRFGRRSIALTFTVDAAEEGQVDEIRAYLQHKYKEQVAAGEQMLTSLRVDELIGKINGYLESSSDVVAENAARNKDHALFRQQYVKQPARQPEADDGGAAPKLTVETKRPQGEPTVESAGTSAGPAVPAAAAAPAAGPATTIATTIDDI